jgi:hypothetical protein
VTPEQIGKWAVLLDRWPEAARAIVRDPALVRRLEASADDAVTFDRLCTDHQPALAGELPPLRDFSHATPKLAEAAKSLVHLESSSNNRRCCRGYRRAGRRVAQTPVWQRQEDGIAVNVHCLRPDTALVAVLRARSCARDRIRRVSSTSTKDFDEENPCIDRGTNEGQHGSGKDPVQPTP